MKKITAALLAVLLLFTATACAQQDAFDLYAKAMEAQTKISSMEAELSMTAKINLGDVSMDLNMTGTVAEVIRSQTDIDMKMVTDMSIMDEDMSVTVYYKDGYMYQEILGQQMKIKMDLSEMLQQVNSSSLEFDRDAITSSSVSKADNGTKISFDLNPEHISDAVADVTGSLTGMLGDTGMDLTISYVRYELVLDKNNLPVSTNMDMGMELTIEGQTATMDYLINVHPIAYNTLTEIDFPADLADYPEA